MLPHGSVRAKSTARVQRRTPAKLVFACLLVLAAPLGLAQSTFELGTVLGGTVPTSTAPWLTATFTDAAPGHVTLTLQSHLNVASEFVGEVCFNLNPVFDLASLTILQLSGPSLQQPPTLSEDGIRLGGAGSAGSGFDILLNWPSASGQGRFGDSESASFDISGPANLDWSDFGYYNTVNGQDGAAILGAHLQGIPAGGGITSSSAIIQNTPEPGSLGILAAALAAFALRRARAACRPGVSA